MTDQRTKDMAGLREEVRADGLDYMVKHVDADILEEHFPWLEMFRDFRAAEQDKLDQALPDFNPVMPDFAPDPDGRVQAWEDAYRAAIKAILKSDLW